LTFYGLTRQENRKEECREEEHWEKKNPATCTMLECTTEDGDSRQ